MLKFNDNNIFIGFIKQILSSFNLPKYKVYTKEQAEYHAWAVAEQARLKEAGVGQSLWPDLEKEIIHSNINKNSDTFLDVLYLKDNEVQRYINNNWVSTDLHYHEDLMTLNQTKKFQIKNNIYDSYTHRYLGDFLRFIRDYYNINLMPLYNCFDNTICNKLYIKSDLKNFIFSTDDQKYKIYMVPVKLFKKYTIAIDSSLPIEFCCGFFDVYHDDRSTLKWVSDYTYKKYSNSIFSEPIIYDKLIEQKVKALTADKINTIAQNESNLKLFIKIPIKNNSSITILEGDYSGYNNNIFTHLPNGNLVTLQNHTVTNYATANEVNGEVVALPEIELRPFEPITSLQLLQANTGTSYPFADRLIEYLSGNTITSEDKITDNIARVQKTMMINNIPFDNTLIGAWDGKIRNIIYDFMNNNKKLIFENHDVLGYVDKDAEKYYAGAKYNQATGNKDITTISNMYLYDDLYKDSQNGGR